MGRSPCCDKQGLKKGPWTPEEDKILVDYIQSHGHGSWRSLPKLAGLLRCGKSCRLRWTNYLRPDIKRGPFTPEEQKSIIQLHGIVGNKWSTIAAQLPGRTDNEIKNYWNTHLKKQLLRMGLNPDTYAPNASPSSPSPSAASSFPATRHMTQWESARLEAEARLSRESLLFSSSNSSPNSSSTPSSTTALSSNSTLPNPKPEPDFFLRMWNSEVGEAFRKTARESTDSSLDSSSTKQSSGVVAPVAENGERREETESKSCSVSGVAGEVAAAGSDSSSSYAAEDASEETYRLYLDFAGDDMGLFQGHLGAFSLFSDLNEASLDTAFK